MHESIVPLERLDFRQRDRLPLKKNGRKIGRREGTPAYTHAGEE